MGVINTGSILSALRPGINEWFGTQYKRYDLEYAKIFEVLNSNMYFERDQSIHGFGLPSVKPEGTAVAFDTMQQGPKVDYQHITYGLGFILTQEAIEDNLYMKLAKSQTEALAHSMRQGKEIVAANVLNRAFTSGYTGYDGVVLCSTAHVPSRGGSYANTFTSGMDLSEDALAQAHIVIGNLTDESGLKLAAKEVSLIVPLDLELEAKKILGTEYQLNSANNDINVVRTMYGEMPVVNHYLTDADAWFIKTDVQNGLKLYQRRALMIDSDNQFDTNDVRFKATERYSVGWTDPRQIFGSPGA